MGKWCHVCEDGTVDWTSDVEQEGLVYLDLPYLGILKGNECKAGMFSSLMHFSELHTLLSFFDLAASSIQGSFQLGVYLQFLKGRSAGTGHPISPEDVTVMLPCYKKARYIRNTVRSFLDQTVLPKSIYILLMDEESQALKDTLELMSPIVRCECHDRLYASSARNYLVERCETEFAALLDADDLVARNYLERLLSDEADFVFPEGIICYASPYSSFHRVNSGGTAACAFLARVSSFKAVGGFAPDLDGCYCEDMDFKWVVLESGFSYREETKGLYFFRLWLTDSELDSSHGDFLQSLYFSLLVFLRRHPATLSVLCEREDWLPPYCTRLLKEFLRTDDEDYLKIVLLVHESLFMSWVWNQASIDALREFSLPPPSSTSSAVFDGSYEGWKFVNCEPSEEDKAFIAERVKGYSFDALFLDRPQCGCLLTFADVLLNRGSMLVRDTLELDGLDSETLYFRCLKRYSYASLPLYESPFRETVFWNVLFLLRLRAFADVSFQKIHPVLAFLDSFHGDCSFLF